MAVNKFGSQVDGRFSPDIGQYYYMVDSNLRTAAQGWSRADGTGPLDLWQARQPHGDQRVFYTPETGNQGTVYATQAAALQAANDAMIDFRGDTLFFTPGDYNIATAVVVNVPYARWTARAYKTPTWGCAPGVRNATITCGVTNALTLSTANAADGWEVSYLRFVPITGDESILLSAAQLNLYWHDFMVDFHGVTESAATSFIHMTAAQSFHLFDQFTWLTDENMGPMFDVAATLRQSQFTNFLHMHDESGGAYVTTLMDLITGGETPDAVAVGPGLIMCGAGIGSTTFTQLIAGTVNLTGTNLIGLYGVINLGAGPATTALVSGSDAGEESWVNNYMPTSGGTLFTS
jgi:hypothetical protein